MRKHCLMGCMLGLAIMAAVHAQEKTAPVKEVAVAQQATPAAAPARETLAAKAKVGAQGATQCDVTANRQQCCGAKNCGGKVFSNRDAHNCANTSGKSWHPASLDGGPAACTNL